ncbi:hypothetical protein J1N09_14770 [Aureitalea sp. L0-47]|uniref:DUF6642 family protein n=1 Tax=Aureitalea sp. L0-47 TaxID=2816962 RepID=UPI0022390CB7|nr:DUF6642 family protein [Aureitalea sp. L0-47]MCW5521109.1 hypothetical protein [Aureitalea sp. L0-47]
MKKGNHVFAIEGEWDNRLDQDLTIKSALDLLKEVCSIEYIFRKVNTVDSLIAYLESSTAASYKKYGVILIASHGSRNDIELSKNESISIEDLGDKCRGWFKGKMVHFSSCGALQNGKVIEKFKQITGTRMVSGYSKSVDFLESSLLDIALINSFYKNNSPVKTGKHLKRYYPELTKSLGFRIL